MKKSFFRVLYLLLAAVLLFSAGTEFFVTAKAEAEPRIIQLVTGAHGSACLREDGMVSVDGSVYVSTGGNPNTYRGQETTIQKWGSLQKIAVSIGSFYGLTRTGELRTDNEEMQQKIGDWKDITDFAVYADSDYCVKDKKGYSSRRYGELVAAVDKDGKVRLAASEEYIHGDHPAPKMDVSKWTDIRSVAVGADHVVGLKSDGTVVFTGSNANGQGKVSGWKNIVAVRAGAYRTVGICKDGTVKVAGRFPKTDKWTEDAKYREIEKWENVIDAAVSQGDVYGLCSDGSVLGMNWKQRDCDSYNAIRENWKQMEMLSAGDCGIIGLRSDGIVMYYGGDVGYEFTPCNLYANFPWPHWNFTEEDGSYICTYCEMAAQPGAGDPTDCLHFWQEDIPFSSERDAYYAYPCNYVCGKCGQILMPKYMDLTNLPILADSDSGKGKDVASVRCEREYNGEVYNAFRFWVMRREGYCDTEWVELALDGEYETLSFVTHVTDNTGENARITYKFYADGHALSSCVPENNYGYGIISVKGVSKLKISCTNASSTEGWGLVEGRLYKNFE